jgi:hypothetical protein
MDAKQYEKYSDEMNTIQLNVQLFANSFPEEYRILIVGCSTPSDKCLMHIQQK